MAVAGLGVVGLVVAIVIPLQRRSNESDPQTDLTAPAVIGATASISSVSTVRFGVTSPTEPIASARGVVLEGAATMTVAANAAGETVGLTLALHDRDLPPLGGSDVRVGFDTTALTLSALQLGLDDPVVIAFYTGLLIDTPELERAADALEQAGLGVTTTLDDLPPAALAPLAELPGAAVRQAAALGPTSSRPVGGAGTTLPFPGERSKAGCLSTAGPAERVGVCIERIQELGGGSYRISGTNDVPSWIGLYDVGEGTAQLVGAIPPRLWQLPSVLSLLSDALYDLGAAALSEAKKGAGWFTRNVLGIDNTWGEDDPELPQRLVARLQSYVGPERFDLEVSFRGAPRLGLYTGPRGATDPEFASPPPAADLLSLLSASSAVIFPALRIAVGLPSRNSASAATDASDRALVELMTDVAPLVGDFASSYQTLLADDFVDFIGGLPKVALDTWLVLTRQEMSTYMLRQFAFDPSRIAVDIAEEVGTTLAISAVKLVDAGVDVANAALTLWDVYEASQRHLGGAVVVLGDRAPTVVPGAATSTTTSTPASTTVAPSTTPPPTTLPPAPSPLPAETEARVVECAAYQAVGAEVTDHGPCEQSEWVLRLQTALTAWELGVPVPLDGRFDPATQRALLLWQVQRYWPDPTAEVPASALLGLQVLSILDDPGVSRTATCPRWISVDLAELGNEILDTSRGSPLLQLCNSGPDVEDVQLKLAYLGYPVEADGYYGLGTFAALQTWKLSWSSPAPQPLDGNVWVADYGALLLD